MGYIFELILMFGMCACAVGLVYCSIALLVSYIPTKQWDRKMKNPPPPPKKKCERCKGSGIWANLSTPLHTYQPCPPCSGTGYINYGYQPTNKVDTSNPPKETGT